MERFLAFVAAAFVITDQRMRREGSQAPPLAMAFVTWWHTHTRTRMDVRPGAARSGQERTDVADGGGGADSVGMTSPPLLLTAKEAAGLLSVSERQLRRLQAAGELSPVRIGGLVRYRRGDVEAVAGVTPRSFRDGAVVKGAAR